MSKNRSKKPDNNSHTSESSVPPSGDMGDSFVQNPDQNMQIHREALGPNTKR